MASTSRAKGAKTGPPIRLGGGRKRAVDSVGRFVAEIYGEDRAGRRRSRRDGFALFIALGETLSIASHFII